MNTSERRQGYSSERIEAERQYRSRYRAENRERLATAAAAGRAEGKAKSTTYYRHRKTDEQREAERASKREAYKRNRGAALEYARLYREKNHERLRVQWKGTYRLRKAYYDRYRAENYDRMRTQRLAWAEANWDHIKRLNAEWTQRNLDRNRVHQHKRRARVRNAGGELSLNIVEALLVRQKGRCACCGVRLLGRYHLDHIIPLALGGANSDNNVQLLTPTCNLQKGATHPIEFMQARRGMLL